MALKGGIVDASGEKISSIRLVTDADANAGLGDALDPIRVDPTGTTVQPVSFSSPQHVIVDSGGGGGTQYTDGTTQATPTGTVALGKNPSNVLHAIALNAAGAQTVDGSAVTQPVSIAAAVTVQQSTAANLKVDLSGTAANATAIKVDGSAVTQPVSIAATVNTSDAANGPVAAGTAATKSELQGAVFNTTAPAPTNGQQVAVQCDSAGSVCISNEGRKATYRAVSTAASVNGISFLITGSGTKKIRIKRILLFNNVATACNYNFTKYSSLPTSGTSSAVSIGPMDSNNAAATATVKSYSVAPTAGTPVAAIHFIVTTATIGQVPPLEIDFGGNGDQPLTLNNANECLGIVASAAAGCVVSVCWTEE